MLIACYVIALLICYGVVQANLENRFDLLWDWDSKGNFIWFYLSHFYYKWSEFVDSCQGHLTTATMMVHRLVEAFSRVPKKVIDR